MQAHGYTHEGQDSTPYALVQVIESRAAPFRDERPSGPSYKFQKAAELNSHPPTAPLFRWFWPPDSRSSGSLLESATVVRKSALLVSQCHVHERQCRHYMLMHPTPTHASSVCRSSANVQRLQLRRLASSPTCTAPAYPSVTIGKQFFAGAGKLPMPWPKMVCAACKVLDGKVCKVLLSVSVSSRSDPRSLSNGEPEAYVTAINRH
jgi:hypothetical protein